MNYDDFVDAPVYDKNGEKMGTIADLYYTVDEHKPEWATVKSGLFGMSRHFVPLWDTREDEDGITINNVTHEMVKNAPSINDDDETTDEDDARLTNYYKYNHQAESGVTPDLSNVQPMPNVDIAQRQQDQSDASDDTYGDSELDTPEGTQPAAEPVANNMHNAIGNSQTERHVLRRYVAQHPDGSKWATKVVVERTPLADDNQDTTEERQ